MLWHDDFFTLSNGQTKAFLKLGKFEGRFIIQHPFFHFGSSFFQRDVAEEEDTPEVFFQQFEITTSKSPFDIDDFLFKVEKNYYLRPDESLWYETGFWTVVLGSDSYMGIGLNKLKDTLKKQKTAKFAVCLSSNISITSINSRVEEEQKIVVSVYASNDVIPFVEVVEPFRKAVEDYNDFKPLKSEILPERKLRRFWGANRRISINPIAFVIDRRHNENKILPVIKNPFTKTKDPLISKIRHITGITSGGFIESDYYGGKQFLPYAEIWNLASTSIIEFNFQQTYNAHV